MKQIFKSFIAVIFFLGILNNPTFSQTPSNEMANTTTGMDRDDEDNNDNWGLLGLLGLLGLIGLKKNDKNHNYSSSNTPQGR